MPALDVRAFNRFYTRRIGVLALDAGYMSRLVRGLKNRGLLASQAHPSDGGQTLVKLSAACKRIELWTQSALTAARGLYAAAGYRLVHSAAGNGFGQDVVNETPGHSLLSPVERELREMPGDSADSLVACFGHVVEDDIPEQIRLWTGAQTGQPLDIRVIGLARGMRWLRVTPLPPPSAAASSARAICSGGRCRWTS